MVKVYEFDTNYKKNKVEEKAYNNLGIIKIKEDLYLVPGVSFETGSTDALEINNIINDASDFLEEDLINEVKGLNVEPGDRVSILLKSESENGLKLFEIMNNRTEKGFQLETVLNMSDESVYMFVGIIAFILKDVIGVRVSMFETCNFEGVKSRVE